jgi:hypothetical protein
MAPHVFVSPYCVLLHVQAVQDFIAANANASSCTPADVGGNSSSNSSSSVPGLPGGSCPKECSGNGECLDSKCFCNTGGDKDYSRVLVGK